MPGFSLGVRTDYFRMADHPGVGEPGDTTAFTIPNPAASPSPTSPRGIGRELGNRLALRKRTASQRRETAKATNYVNSNP